MATHTRPFLMTGAALASAAAVVVATPQLMPSVTAPSPLKLSQAQFELTTLADLLALTPADYAAAYFQGFGGVVGNPDFNDPTKDDPWNIWYDACGGECFIAGLSGVAYQALDALINGGTENVNALNYYFEGGLSGGNTYLLQTTVGAANPVLSTLITLIEAGPQLVTEVWTTALATAASLINVIPVVGPIVAGGIYAYLGDGGYTPGLTGVLNYVIDLFTGGLPEAAAATAAASLAAVPAAAAALAAPLSRAPKTAEPKAEVAAAVAAPEVSADKATAADDTATEDAAAEAGAEDPTAESTDTPKVDVAPAGEATESAPEAEAPKVDAPAAGQTETATEAPAASTDSAPKPRKRPIRDAVEKVTAGISGALKGTAKPAAEPAGADTAGAGAEGSAADAG